MMRERLKEQWKAFLPHLKETPLRFPLAFASALAFSVIVILSIHDLSLLDDEVLARSLWFCVVAFFLFLAGHLLGESRGWPRSQTILLSLAAGGFLAWRIATTRPRGDRLCVFSELSDRVARPFRCPASLRIRLLAERSEKTSL